MTTITQAQCPMLVYHFEKLYNIVMNDWHQYSESDRTDVKLWECFTDYAHISMTDTRELLSIRVELDSGAGTKYYIKYKATGNIEFTWDL